MTISRPTGITILAILKLISSALISVFGLLGLFIGGRVYFTQAPETVTYSTENLAMFIIIMVTGGAFLLLIGLFGLIIGYGLLTLKLWGWALAMLFYIGSLTLSISVINQEGNISNYAIVSIFISSLILCYLCHPDIRRAFGW